MNYFSDFRFVDLFRRYSRSKSKVVRNREKLWTVFWPSQILGGRPSKNCTHVITHGSPHVVWLKSCHDISISPEVIGVHTLNFEPNFKCSRLNIFGGPPSQLGCALGSLGQSLARVKISGHSTSQGPKYSLPKKVHQSVNLLEEITSSFVERSTQTFFIQRGSGCRFSRAFPIFDVLIRSGDIRDQSRKLSEIAKNFGLFLPSQIIGGKPFKI